MVCFAHTGTCGFPTEVDVSDKTILPRYSNNWGNLADNETQEEYGALRDELRDAAPDDPRLNAIADVTNRDFPMAGRYKLRVPNPGLESAPCVSNHTTRCY
jgi:hypothetical protein